jgi:AcrR family transcriptional regulator
MAQVGRRPGNQDTRAAILAAARACFTEEGYEQASLRGIARRAGVDPALVHHYFAGKAQLFVEVLYLGRDPRQTAEAVMASEAGRGERLMREFLRQWERPGAERDTRFVNMAQAVAGSSGAADALREFLVERVWSTTLPDAGPAEELRRCRVSSQLFGVAWDRYVLRLEPFASASIDEIAAWMGPLVELAMNDGVPADIPNDTGDKAARTAS